MEGKGEGGQEGKGKGEGRGEISPPRSFLKVVAYVCPYMSASVRSFSARVCVVLPISTCARLMGGPSSTAG